MIAPRDLSFANAAAADSDKAKTHASGVSPPMAEREELPSAYSAQVTVDVEAEVSAFRDKE
jgi:hypothetical protein